MKKSVVIMAGGLGSRYKALKQVDSLFESGETLLEFSIHDAIEAGFLKFILVINHLVPNEFLEKLTKIASRKKIEIEFVYQEKDSFVPNDLKILAQEREKPWGTGHAVLVAKKVVNEPFVVINADDFYGKESFQVISNAIDSTKINEKNFGMVAFPLLATLSENGKVSRGVCSIDENQKLIKIQETTIEKSTLVLNEESQKAFVSMNFWAFHPKLFSYLEEQFVAFLQKKPEAKDEFFIPTVIQNLMLENLVRVQVYHSQSKWYGMTYPEDKKTLVEFLDKQKKQGLYEGL